MEKYIDSLANNVKDGFIKAIAGESELDCSFKNGIM